MSEQQRNQGAKPDADRLPPHSPEAEQGVIGCCMLEAALLGDVQQKLDPEAFYDLRHREIYNAALRLYTAKKAVDLITLSDELKMADMLDKVGGLSYVMTLPNTVPSAANLSYYLEIVREKWMLRRLLATCADVARRVYEFDGTADQLMDEVERDLGKVAQARVMQTEAVPINKLILEGLAQLEEDFSRGRKWKIGPQTPWNYMNNIIPGFAPGELALIAARPSMGKSALAMQISEHAALAENVPVYVMSLEMSGRSMAMRELFQRAGSNLQKMRNGFLPNADVTKLVNASGHFSKAQWWIESAHRMYLEDLELKARRMKMKHGLGMIVVDYFQLLHMRARMEDRLKEMNEMSMRLKALAMELQVPVLVCSQMNRSIETSERPRPPMLSDIKDCGQLEQDADIVIMLWKPKIPEPEEAESREMIWLSRMNEAGIPAAWCGTNRMPAKGEPRYWEKNLRRINAYVAKQREGRADEDAQLVFVKPWCRFIDAWRPDAVEEEDDDTVVMAAPKRDESALPTNEELGV